MEFLKTLGDKEPGSNTQTAKSSETEGENVLKTSVDVRVKLAGNKKQLLVFQVKLSLQDSWAHASSLRLELLSNQAHTQPSGSSNEPKQQKASIIQVWLFTDVRPTGFDKCSQFG